MWIRTASPDDIEAIGHILQASWHAAYDELIGHAAVDAITRDWYDPMHLAQEMMQPESEYIVADDGVQLYGVAHALSGALPTKPDIVVIRQLCVHPSHQNQGLGTKLLDELENCFPAARRFQLWIMEKNERELQFFSRRSYRPVETSDIPKSPMNFFKVLLEKDMQES